MKGDFCSASHEAWLIGFAVSLLGGLIGSLAIVSALRRLMDWPLKQGWKGFAFTTLIGLIERSGITAVATYELGSAVTFSAVWIGLKVASNWNRPGLPGGVAHSDDLQKLARLATSSLAGSLVSIAFALGGAMFICGKL